MIRMPVVYVAGPFRAPTAWQRERNIREAEELAYLVAEAGAMPLCPHTNTRFFDGTLTDEFWLAGTVELLQRCDAAAFTVRWPQSQGARAEMEDCIRAGRPVFRESEVRTWEGPGSLRMWVKTWQLAATAGRGQEP